jgi:hypothetical protein
MQAGDVLGLLEWNDAHRRADAEGGLVCVDEWASGAFFGAFAPEFPTLAPRGWASTPPVTQEEYTARFEAKLPEIAAVLRETEGVVVAGGAACMPFCGRYGEFGDVDLFVCGVEHGARWDKAHELAASLRAAFADARCVTETLSPGVLTFRVYRSHGPALKVQLVLRLFATASSALHGFDVGACAVCFDGRVARMTRLAAFCIAHRVTVVHPPYRSPSYAHRLAKYFARGFALVFVGMRRGALERDAALALGGELLVTPRTVHGLLAFGEARAARGYASDYEPEEHGFCARARLAHFAMLATNATLVAEGKTRFVVAGAQANGPTPRSARTVLPLDRFAVAEPTFSDALPREAFERFVDATVRGAVTPRGLVNARSLKRVLGLDDAQIGRFAAAVASSSARVDATRALAPFRSALMAKYDAVPSSVDWWLVEDPTRPFTASTSPTPATPAEWYGDAATATLEPPTKDETIEALVARLGARAPRNGADGVCPLCYEALGDLNVVTLACGHSAHFGESTGCLGLVAWANQTCPMCRAPFAATLERAVRRAPAPLDVEL